MVMYAVFVKVLRVGAGIENWPIALLTGIVLWQFFTEVTGRALKSIVSQGNLLRKIKFPRYIIVLSSTVSALITLGLNSIVVIGFAIFSGVKLSWGILLIFPLVLELFIFALGVAFFLATIYVKFRDIQYIWDVITQALFYGSAIIFPVSMIANMKFGATLSQIALANPICQVIQDVRHFAINPEIMNLAVIAKSWTMYFVPLAITLIIFVLGGYYFRRRSPFFAEDI